MSSASVSAHRRQGQMATCSGYPFRTRIKITLKQARHNRKSFKCSRLNDALLDRMDRS